MQTAILSALARGVPHPNAVRLALEAQREARHAPPPVPVCLSPAVLQRDSVVRPHRLDTYDQLTQPATPSGDSNESNPQ